MSMGTYNVGVVGATGAVGKEIVGVLEKRSFPVSNLRIFGSERSAGKVVDTTFGSVTVELFDVISARECDVVFLAVDGDFSLKYAEALCDGDDGPVVIDNSSAFRYREDVPLVVPEINAEKTKGKKLISNPNCTTAIGLMAIWPLHKLFGLTKMVMSVSFFFNPPPRCFFCIRPPLGPLGHAWGGHDAAPHMYTMQCSIVRLVFVGGAVNRGVVMGGEVPNIRFLVSFSSQYLSSPPSTTP